MRKDKHPLFNIWKSMRGRCRNPNSPQYKDYGGRGISIDPSWDDFWTFLSDMGPRPEGHSLDRINNDGDYGPSNCRWATRKEQQRNQRRAVYVNIEGLPYRAIELAERYGLKTDTIVDRASKGMPFAEVTKRARNVYSDGLALGGKANGDRQRAKTHCPYGHAYDAENTYFSKQGYRRCRACRTVSGAQRRFQASYG